MKNKTLLFTVFCFGMITSHSIAKNEKITNFPNVGSDPNKWEFYLDDYKCISPICPDCVIDQDVQIDLNNKDLRGYTDFIYRNGFEGKK